MSYVIQRLDSGIDIRVDGRFAECANDLEFEILSMTDGDIERIHLQLYCHPFTSIDLGVFARLLDKVKKRGRKVHLSGDPRVLRVLLRIAGSFGDDGLASQGAPLEPRPPNLDGEAAADHPPPENLN